MSEPALRDAVARWGASMFSRGLTSGSSGNISVRVDGGYLATPTNSCLGFLEPARLSRLDASGAHIGGDKPTKELPLHRAFYENRRDAQAVVHLHSSFATALSCLTDTDAANAIPPLTPYVAMRVGRVPLVPYARPGSGELAVSIARLASKHVAVLIQNHGPVVCGRTLEDAVYAIEELEEAAKVALLTRGLPVRVLAPESLAELERHFKLR